MSYAVDTVVSVEKSRAEIESILGKYGASSFGYMTTPKGAMIGFVANGKSVRFSLPLPDKNDKRFWFTAARRRQRTQEEAYKEWEQACRSRWRALCLCIKAKLEAVECGITTFETEFLAHFVLPNGQTFGEHAIPQLEEVKMGNMPMLMLSDSK